MQKTLVALLLLTSILFPAEAADLYQPEPRKTGLSAVWQISVAALAAASAADVHSSWGRLEANPVLAGPNGRFGMQGVALKSAIAGGVVAAQYLMLRNHPKASKYGAWVNFGMAGVISAAAVS